MYSHEARTRAVSLYVSYGRALATTIRELGYPSRGMLRAWYREFVKTGDLHQGFRRADKYSNEQMQRAVEHYCKSGRCISRTAAVLGYPNHQTLRKWIDELRPGIRKVSIRRGSAVSFSAEEKQRAVVDLCSREGSAAAISRQVGTSRQTSYSQRRYPHEWVGEAAILRLMTGMN